MDLIKFELILIFLGITKQQICDLTTFMKLAISLLKSRVKVYIFM